MFEHLTRHDVILVSGPNRSGTRIAGKMIAADTGYQNIEEKGFGIYNQIRFRDVIQQPEIVVQCPSMSHILHEVATSHTLVVFMIRNLDDIMTSERRVRWIASAYKELKNYGLPAQPARRYRHHGGQIAPLKYAFWWGMQRAQVQHWLELEYESLSAHPLWVPKEQRTEFAMEQTEIS